MTVVVKVTPTGSATGYVVDRESMIDRPGADDDGGFVIHVEGVPSSVPPTVVVLAVGSGLRKIVERGGFRIHWSEMDGSDSQYDGYIRLQTDERDEEDEEERQREEEERLEEERRQEDDDAWLQERQREEEDYYDETED